MPPYPWLLKDDLNVDYTPKKIEVMRSLGVPYEEDFATKATADLKSQAEVIAANLKSQGINDADASKEIIALIAYLQRLGTDIKGMSSAAK